MDRNSYLNPDTIIEQCDNAIRNLQADTEALMIMETGLDNFITNDEIKSKAFDALKQQIADYKTVIAAMIRANDSDILDFTRLKTLVGDKVLEGDRILDQKEKALSSYYKNKDSAYEFNVKALNAIEPWLSWYYYDKAKYYNLLAAADYAIYQEYEKLEKYYNQIEEDTSSLFLEALDVREVALSALKSITKSVKDGVYSPDMEAPWRGQLAREVFDLSYQDSGEDASWWEIFLNTYFQGRKGYANLSGDALQLMLSPTMIGLIGAVTKQLAEGKSIEEAIRTVFGYYIPHFVEEDSLLLLLEVLAVCNNMPEEKIAEHLKHNEEAWKNKHDEYEEQSNDGYWYIEHQGKMDEMLFGNLTANKDSCGAIATYNTFVNLNRGTSPVSFSEVLSDYEKYGIVANGELGMSATAINSYLMLRGYQTEFLSGIEITDKSLAKIDEEYDAFIIMAYNNSNDINSCVHFMSITKEVGKNKEIQYVLHNDFSSNGKAEASSLQEAISNYNYGKSAAICVIGVEK